MSELVMSGHSFGGLTALMAASKLGPRCKAVQVMDPWLFAYCEEFAKGQLTVKCPVQVINSELFHPSVQRDFDSWDTLKAFLNNSHH
jgi:pimeloyl-ACP methyl ester carboxylesterase